ncbi:hypothetical protein DFH11DRAFT_1856907 [Phellopilus nigrolimitatus]|nr:hypothetical protein DFH11DRAFT_1856907 [Phellopilus nigrolimitatus]
MKADKFTPVLTGYYRFSDILFEWHKEISDPAERSALKAFVSSNSLGDPGNPLRTDKEKGIKLFIGTLPSGLLRLMFSSGQIEYIRYWLHAMGFTKELLPLPTSDYLLTNSTLRNCSETYYKDAAEVKKALREVDKNNRRLRGTDSGLMSFRQIFEKVRKYWGDKAGTWLAIDFEAWEMEHSLLTECGWSYLQLQGDKTIEKYGHYIVKENITYTNGRYVPNQRNNYNFGQSEVLNKATFKKEISGMITEFQKLGPLFLVFHDCNQDVMYLKSSYINAPIEGIKYFLPDNTPDNGTFVIDTSDLFSALEGDVSEKRSLKKMCDLLRIPTEYMHNAGNDAHYTLLALKSMASGNQLDIQREERWPNQTEGSAETGSTVKVKHNAWDEDSDYSDMEGAFGRPVDGRMIDQQLSGLTVSDDEDM